MDTYIYYNSRATQWYQYYKEKNELEENVKALDFEIEGRLSQFLNAARPLLTSQSDTTYHFTNDSCRKVFINLWNELKTPPEKNSYIFTTYTEYQKVSLLSAMSLLSKNLFDLGYDVNEAKENGYSKWKDFDTLNLKNEIYSIKTSVRTLLSNFILDYEHESAANPESDIMKLFKDLFDKVLLKRWQWRYKWVDCNYKKPFC